MELLEEAMTKYRIDAERLYVTGYSMGGYGTWSLAAEHPELFAALAPICGGWDAKEAERIKHIPQWVFHGDDDTVVPIEESRKMVEALKKLDAPVRFTVYPGVGHNAWTPAYDDEELWKWMLEQKRER
jgi:predicted peptidase